MDIRQRAEQDHDVARLDSSQCRISAHILHADARRRIGEEVRTTSRDPVGLARTEFTDTNFAGALTGLVATVRAVTTRRGAVHEITRVDESAGGVTRIVIGLTVFGVRRREQELDRGRGRILHGIERGEGFVGLAHRGGEQMVDEVQHRRLTPKVDAQRQAASRGNLLPQLREDTGIGSTKAVDRLLGIANEKQSTARQRRPAQHPHDIGLNRIGVLKLINHQQPNARSDAISHVGVVSQKITGLQQEVVKVEQPLRLLGRLKGIGSESRESQRAAGKLGRQLQIVFVDRQ